MRATRLTWAVGGGGLVLCAVLGMLRNALPGSGSVSGPLIDAVFAAAVLLFAVGLSPEASVVARRPLGVAALAVVALWPMADRILQPILLTAGGVRYVSLDEYRAVAGVQTSMVAVSLAAALIAAVQIGRVGTVPSPWQWAALWAWAATVTAGVLAQLILRFTAPADSQNLADATIALDTLGFLARTLGLGILALVLSARDRRGSVDVLRSH